MNEIEEAITAQWGERCPDFDKDCACCKAWAMYDAMQGAERIAGLADGLKAHSAGYNLGFVAGLKEAVEIADRSAREAATDDAMRAFQGMSAALRNRIAKLKKGSE